jgi:hypothetical protein
MRDDEVDPGRKCGQECGENGPDIAGVADEFQNVNHRDRHGLAEVKDVQSLSDDAAGVIHIPGDITDGPHRG